MTGLDWIVVALYFALVLAAAMLPGLRARKAGRDSAE